MKEYEFKYFKRDWENRQDIRRYGWEEFDTAINYANLDPSTPFYTEMKGIVVMRREK